MCLDKKIKVSKEAVWTFFNVAQYDHPEIWAAPAAHESM